MAVPTILVLSVKGGSGKTLVACNVAQRLSEFGPVGLVDADSDSPHLPSMLGLDATISLDSNSKFTPVQIDGNPHPIRIISFGMMGQFKGKGITQSGRQHMTIIKDMITKSAWGPLSYRIVDLPAGSADAFIETVRLFKNIRGIIAVSQPSTVEALMRVLDIVQYHGLPLLGVIANMSGVSVSDCCGERVCCSKCLSSFIPFPGDPSIERVCKKNAVEFFGEIPLTPMLSKTWKLNRGLEYAIDRAIRRIRA